MTRRAGVTPAVAIVVGLLAAIACRADEGERCVCADDCKQGLTCVSGGRELRGDECLAADEDAEPGRCIDGQAGGDGGDDPFGGDLLLDLGAKRDFEPEAPPQASSGSGEPVGSDDGASSSGSTGSSSGSSDGGTATSGTTSTGSDAGGDTDASGTT